ncbi:MAG TPA: hypothetical protein PLY34_07090 [Ferruginibacter sp.]|nr:hypothetical protein [Ferruginibacter sp.]HPH89436.1 hypothetical protein [Ferruginibacter sp.]
MLKNSREQLLNFISHHQLKKENGIICFDAHVRFFEPVAVNTFSEIQIISLPFEHALYVINCPDSLPQGCDVYSTSRFNFSKEEDEELIITAGEGQKILTLSLKKT